MKKIHKICALIAELDEEDFKIAEEWATEQKQYTHPLKHATARRTNKVGENNLEIIQRLKSLKDVIENGKP